jgi:hypothetical protein
MGDGGGVSKNATFTSTREATYCWLAKSSESFQVSLERMTRST